MPKAAELVIQNWTTSNGFVNFDTNRRVVNNRLEIDALSGYPAVSSSIRYDMVSSHFGVHLVSTPNISNGSTEVLISAELNPSNMISIGWGNGGLYTRKVVAGVTTNTYLSYSAVQHKYLRIREAAGQVYWEGSPTGETWTNLKAPEATPFDMSSVLFILLSGNWNSATSPGMATFGAVNSYDSATPAAPTTKTVDYSNLASYSRAANAYPELEPIWSKPQARWILESTTPANIQQYITEAAGKTLILSIYAIPNRDNGNYSAGGFPDRAAYISWLTSIRDAIGTAPAIIAYEADALGLSRELEATARAERVETLRQGVTILSALTNADVYIDASSWVSTTEQATLLQSVDVAKVTGFVINVSGYNHQTDMYAYGNNVATSLTSLGITGKQFIVDSSRNGAGPLTEADRPLGSPWLDRSQEWCNPPKRLVGMAPGPITGQGAARATLWIKAPGESDGTFPDISQSSYFGESAPSAGTFWLALSRDLIGLSPTNGSTPSQPAGTGTITDVASNFNTWGSFTKQFNSTLVDSRARVPLNTNFDSIATESTYKLAGGSLVARMYMPVGVAASADADAFSSLLVNPGTPGARAIILLYPKTNTARFHIQNEYWDTGAGPDLPYDTVEMAWVRIREAAGQVYLETSPTGAGSWTVRRQVATPAWASTSTSSVAFQTYASVAGGYAEIDSVNTSTTVNNTFRLENGVWIATNTYKKFFP